MDPADLEQPDAAASNRDAVLESVGVPRLAAEDAARISERVRRRSAALRDAIVSSAFTVGEFAARSGLHVADVEERLRARTIWSWVEGDGRTLIPDWALRGEEPLQGLDVVAPAVPAEMAVLSVHGLMTTPNPDLVIDDESVSVLDWLRADGSPEAAFAAIGEAPPS